MASSNQSSNQESTTAYNNVSLNNLLTQYGRIHLSNSSQSISSLTNTLVRDDRIVHCLCIDNNIAKSLHQFAQQSDVASILSPDLKEAVKIEPSKVAVIYWTVDTYMQYILAYSAANYTWSSLFNVDDVIVLPHVDRGMIEQETLLGIFRLVPKENCPYLLTTGNTKAFPHNFQLLRGSGGKISAKIKYHSKNLYPGSNESVGTVFKVLTKLHNDEPTDANKDVLVMTDVNGGDVFELVDNMRSHIDAKDSPTVVFASSSEIAVKLRNRIRKEYGVNTNLHVVTDPDELDSDLNYEIVIDMGCQIRRKANVIGSVRDEIVRCPRSESNRRAAVATRLCYRLTTKKEFSSRPMMYHSEISYNPTIKLILTLLEAKLRPTLVLTPPTLSNSNYTRQKCNATLYQLTELDLIAEPNIEVKRNNNESTASYLNRVGQIKQPYDQQLDLGRTVTSLGRFVAQSPLNLRNSLTLAKWIQDGHEPYEAVCMLALIDGCTTNYIWYPHRDRNESKESFEERIVKHTSLFDDYRGSNELVVWTKIWNDGFPEFKYLQQTGDPLIEYCRNNCLYYSKIEEARYIILRTLEFLQRCDINYKMGPFDEEKTMEKLAVYLKDSYEDRILTPVKSESKSSTPDTYTKRGINCILSGGQRISDRPAKGVKIICLMDEPTKPIKNSRNLNNIHRVIRLEIAAPEGVSTVTKQVDISSPSLWSIESLPIKSNHIIKATNNHESSNNEELTNEDSTDDKSKGKKTKNKSMNDNSKKGKAKAKKNKSKTNKKIQSKGKSKVKQSKSFTVSSTGDSSNHTPVNSSNHTSVNSNESPVEEDSKTSPRDVDNQSATETLKKTLGITNDNQEQYSSDEIPNAMPVPVESNPKPVYTSQGVPANSGSAAGYSDSTAAYSGSTAAYYGIPMHAGYTNSVGISNQHSVGMSNQQLQQYYIHMQQRTHQVVQQSQMLDQIAKQQQAMIDEYLAKQKEELDRLSQLRGATGFTSAMNRGSN